MKEISCTDCKYCRLSAYNSGRWYCGKRSVFDCVENIKECFGPRKGKKNGK